MKINILYEFQNQPWGGGNQFLKALKKELVKKEVYEESPEKADAIIFNSHHGFNEAFKIKRKFGEKIFVHRIDGPVCLRRGGGKDLDKIIFRFNKLFADGIIFQSNWCMKQNKKLFGVFSKYESVIYNAPDGGIFNKIGKKEFNPKEKIKLIVSSWSPGWKKGFDTYKYLDEKLDFSKYEMTFVGNSPIEFKNINWIKPVSSEKLAEILKQNDIYITASQNDPCSNALIEALSCGLPTVALNDGGHPELAGNGGELFTSKNDIIKKIEKVTQNYQSYQSKIPEFLIEKIAQEYYEFVLKIYTDVQNGKWQPKLINFSTEIKFYKIKLAILKYRLTNKFQKAKKYTTNL